jgi:sialate O-acetylesterase
LVSLSNAALVVSNTLGSNMVLQRAPLQANIWGWGVEGATVTLTFNKQNFSTQASKTDGSWSITLPATQAGGPYDIAISSSVGGNLLLTNILFGDVYLCSGQSNMQFTVDSAFNSTYEVALANKYPNIRVFSVGTETYSGTPLGNLAAIQLKWSVASSASIGGGNWSYMSAVCWFFGRDLYNQYEVPIGLISSNWGGTYIQAWSSPEVNAQCKVPVPTYNKTGGPNQPSVLYNAMIVPFLPMSIRGALWYQGEANVGNAPLYACLEPAMIADWRSKFARGFKFPFFFVMLAPWIATQASSVPTADLRASQLSALSLPSVGYANAVDLGDPVSPFDPIHPRNKQEVSARLVLAARHIAYGENTVVWEGPTFSSASQSVSNGVATIQLNFITYGQTGIYSKQASCPSQVPSNTCANWEVQLSDGNWYAASNVASSTMTNDITVTLTLPSSSLTVKGIRYAYAIWPLITLFSAEGLPVVPFSYSF